MNVVVCYIFVAIWKYLLFVEYSKTPNIFCLGKEGKIFPKNCLAATWFSVNTKYVFNYIKENDSLKLFYKIEWFWTVMDSSETNFSHFLALLLNKVLERRVGCKMI